MKSVSVPSPAPEVHVRRLSEAMKAIEPDSETGYELETAEAKCLLAYGRTCGWKMVQRRKSDKIITVWRIA